MGLRGESPEGSTNRQTEAQESGQGGPKQPRARTLKSEQSRVEERGADRGEEQEPTRSNPQGGPRKKPESPSILVRGPSQNLRVTGDNGASQSTTGREIDGEETTRARWPTRDPEGNEGRDTPPPGAGDVLAIERKRGEGGRRADGPPSLSIEARSRQTPPREIPRPIDKRRPQKTSSREEGRRGGERAATPAEEKEGERGPSTGL